MTLEDEIIKAGHKAWRVLKPGGPVFGLNPKKSFITPIDFIPFVGPANKIRQGAKVWKSRAAFKRLAQGASQIPGDVLLLVGLGAYLATQKSHSSGLGAPIGLSQTAPKASARRCPPGFRWSQSKGRCVRIGPGKRS